MSKIHQTLYFSVYALLVFSSGCSLDTPTCPENTVEIMTDSRNECIYIDLVYQDEEGNFISKDNDHCSAGGTVQCGEKQKCNLNAATVHPGECVDKTAEERCNPCGLGDTVIVGDDSYICTDSVCYLMTGFSVQNDECYFSGQKLSRKCLEENDDHVYQIKDSEECQNVLDESFYLASMYGFTDEQYINYKTAHYVERMNLLLHTKTDPVASYLSSMLSLYNIELCTNNKYCGNSDLYAYLYEKIEIYSELTEMFSYFDHYHETPGIYYEYTGGKVIQVKFCNLMLPTCLCINDGSMEEDSGCYDIYDVSTARENNANKPYSKVYDNITTGDSSALYTQCVLANEQISDL